MAVRRTPTRRVVCGAARVLRSGERADLKNQRRRERRARLGANVHARERRPTEPRWDSAGSWARVWQRVAMRCRCHVKKVARRNSERFRGLLGAHRKLNVPARELRVGRPGRRWCDRFRRRVRRVERSGRVRSDDRRLRHRHRDALGIGDSVGHRGRRGLRGLRLALSHFLCEKGARGHTS